MLLYEKFFSKIVKPNITLKEIESRIRICNRDFINDYKKNKAKDKLLEYESKSFTVKNLTKYNNHKRLIAEKTKEDDKKRTISRRTSTRMSNILRKKSILGMEGLFKADFKATLNLKNSPTKLPNKDKDDMNDTIDEKLTTPIKSAPKRSKVFLYRKDITYTDSNF